MLLPAQPAVAARGAAELDLEYYMRDLMGGNKKEGNVLPSTPPPLLPPRTLQGPLLPLLLNKECSPSCIPVQVLMEQVQQTTSTSKSSNSAALAQTIQDRVTETRDKTRSSFYAKAPWNEAEVTDQYYFDVTAYALWKTAAELLPNPLDRDQFVRNLGRRLVEKAQSEKLLNWKGSSSNNDDNTLVGSTPAILAMLQLFQSSGYCKGYRIRTTDDVVVLEDSKKKGKNSQQQQQPPQPIFDELDDEGLQAGGTVDCLVSVYESASLGASLQINGEQSRFGPDFVGTSLAAIWESTASVQSSWEVFFVDAEYRPNPKGKSKCVSVCERELMVYCWNRLLHVLILYLLFLDYFPNEQLLQLTLTKKRK